MDNKPIYIDVYQCPYGFGIDIGDGDFSYCIGGVHGGGVMTTVKRFKVNVPKLKQALEELTKEKENEE